MRISHRGQFSCLDAERRAIDTHCFHPDVFAARCDPLTHGHVAERGGVLGAASHDKKLALHPTHVSLSDILQGERHRQFYSSLEFDSK